MFSNTLSFLFFRNVSDQVSHPYKTTGKIIVLYILIFKLTFPDLHNCSLVTVTGTLYGIPILIAYFVSFLGGFA